MGYRDTHRSEALDILILTSASYGCTYEEIAFSADIHRATLYRWLEEDPEFKYQVEKARERPVMLARQTIVKSLTQPEHAKWFIERKRKGEFSTRNEITGKDGVPVGISAEAEKIANEAIDAYLKSGKTHDNTGNITE